MTELTGKVALVTGGSRGIGAAIAKRLAKEGADVALTYVSAADRAAGVVDDIKAIGQRGLAIAADSADADAVQAAVEQTVAEFGRLDILVNNAGVYVGGALEDMTLDVVDKALAVNVRAVIVGSLAAARHLPDGGRIITIGSTLGDRVPFAGATVYSATKAALVGFTKGLARDLGPRHITANLVAPGPIDTEMNPADGEHAGGQVAQLGISRYGHVDEIAATVSYLAGPGAAYTSGATILVDGAFAA